MKLAALFAAAVSLVAQQPRISNARVETRAVTGGLEATFRSILSAQETPAWVGYAEPIIRSDGSGKRQSWCDWPEHGPRTVKLEGPTDLVVLYRVENHQIGEIRTFAPECDLDAGGLPFLWLTGVTAPESIRFLLSNAKTHATRCAHVGSRHIGDRAPWRSCGR